MHQQLGWTLFSFVFRFLSLDSCFNLFSALSLPLSWLDSYGNIRVHYANVAANRHANVNISTCQ